MNQIEVADVADAGVFRNATPISSAETTTGWQDEAQQQQHHQQNILHQPPVQQEIQLIPAVRQELNQQIHQQQQRSQPPQHILQQHCTNANGRTYQLQYTNASGSTLIGGSPVHLPALGHLNTVDTRSYVFGVNYYDQQQIDRTALDLNATPFYGQQQLAIKQQQEILCGRSKSSVSSSANSPCDENSQKIILPDNSLPLSENELEQISVRDLNKLLQGQERSLVTKVKAKRRTLKNRGYALKCRSRRVEIQQRLTVENRALREQLQAAKRQLEALQPQQLHSNKQQQLLANGDLHPGYYQQTADANTSLVLPTVLSNRCVIPVPTICLSQQNDHPMPSKIRMTSSGGKNLDSHTGQSPWSKDYNQYTPKIQCSSTV